MEHGTGGGNLTATLLRSSHPLVAAFTSRVKLTLLQVNEEGRGMATNDQPGYKKPSCALASPAGCVRLVPSVFNLFSKRG